MTATVGRRTFLRGAGALAAGMAIGGPLEAFAARAALGAPAHADGYGELVDKGDLRLPRRFHYRIISRQGELMSDGNPTPSRFDGMVAFRAGEDETILMRNHENKRRLTVAGTFAPANEIDVIVPDELRYDPNPLWNGGVVRLVVDDRRVEDSRAVLGGTTHNCAGGPTPWGSWITCEELFQPPPSPAGFTTQRHGYIFEVDARKKAPSAAVPITSAGRFEHEAVAWFDGALYETEDRPNASFYRYLPSTPPKASGDLAASNAGLLQALVVSGFPTLDTRSARGWPGGVGATHSIEWVTIPAPAPVLDGPGCGRQIPGPGSRGRDLRAHRRVLGKPRQDLFSIARPAEAPICYPQTATDRSSRWIRSRTRLPWCFSREGRRSWRSRTTWPWRGPAISFSARTIPLLSPNPIGSSA